VKRLEHYLALAYQEIVTPEDCTDGSRCYLARCPELPGCESHGSTADEALENLREARRLYIATILEDGREPPEPTAVTEGTGYAMSAIWRIEDVSRPPAAHSAVGLPSEVILPKQPTPLRQGHSSAP
jgi:predicted RNase H-like HicB family nuclease